MVTDADPGTVRADFAGATPPVLAFQWGIADDVRRSGDGGVDEISYLLGLRSTRVATEVRSRPSDDVEPVDQFELLVTTGGEPWGTYAVSVDGRDGRTVVDIEVSSDRRFGLRRLPQWLIAERYREEALGVQGYTVVERDVNLSPDASDGRIGWAPVSSRSAVRPPGTISTDLIACFDSFHVANFSG